MTYVAQTQDVRAPQGQPVFSCVRAKTAQTWSWCERGKRQHTCWYTLAYLRACVLTFLQDCVMNSAQPLGPAHSSPIMLRSSYKEDPGNGWDLTLRPPASVGTESLVTSFPLSFDLSSRTPWLGVKILIELNSCQHAFPSANLPVCCCCCWLKLQLSAICSKSPT